MPTPILWPIVTPPTPQTLPAPIGTTASAPTDYGADISCAVPNRLGIPDLDPMFILRRGPQVLTEAVARRLQTPRGLLYYDPNYGKDVREYVEQALDAAGVANLQTDTQNELLKDERIVDVKAVVTGPTNTGVLKEKVGVVTGTGPFSHTLPISQVTASIFDYVSGAPTGSASGNGGETLPITLAISNATVTASSTTG